MISFFGMILQIKSNIWDSASCHLWRCALKFVKTTNDVLGFCPVIACDGNFDASVTELHADLNIKCRFYYVSNNPILQQNSLL